MPDAEDTAAPASQLWSRKKIALIFLGIPLLTLISVVAIILKHDAKLEPYDDLLPVLTSAPGPETNGYAFLLREWGAPSEKVLKSGAARRRWDNIRNGMLPWVDSIAEELNPEHKDFQPILTEAVARPVWLCPLSSSSEENPADWSHSWNDYYLSPLMAESRRGARAGNPQLAVNLIKDIRLLARRQIAGAGYFQPLSRGFEWEEENSEFTCHIVNEGQVSGEALARLAEVWSEDVIDKTSLQQAVFGECAEFRDWIAQASNPGEMQDGHRSWRWLLIKPNQCLNLNHREARRILSHCLKTGPKRTYEPDGATVTGGNFISKLNPNAEGLEMVGMGIRSADFFLGDFPRSILFRSRALRVWLAIQRWRIAHPGQWPTTLKELVPEFLPAIPPDPWDGKPLRWNAADQLITGVGIDWIDNPVGFSAKGRTWFGGDNNGPALRMTPPPPPPPPLPPKAFRKKAPAASPPP